MERRGAAGVGFEASARARTTELRGNEKSYVVVMALLPTDGLEPSALGSHRGESCRAVSVGGGELVLCFGVSLCTVCAVAIASEQGAGTYDSNPEYPVP